jgi:hypothetical protein
MLPVNSFSDELTKISTQLKSLPGGKAHNHHLEEYDPEQLQMGYKVEREHTADPKKRLEISVDHLEDNKKYYTILRRSGLADELEKIALDLWKATMGVGAAQAAWEAGKHGPWGRGGQSKPEVRAGSEFEIARNNLMSAAPGTDEHERAKKKLLSATKNYEKTVGKAESAGSGLLGMAGLYGGSKAADKLSERIIKEESKFRTFPVDVAHLRDVISPTANVQVADTDIGGAWGIPKGGRFPKFMRKLDEYLYSRQGIPEDVIQEGLKKGLNVLPHQAGRHYSAFELGRHAIGESKAGKVLRHSIGPAAVLGVSGAAEMASTGDPDSLKAKLAPLVAAGSLAPHFGEQLWASSKAMKGLRQIGASAQELSTARKQLAKSLGTHALMYAAPAAAVPAAIRLVRKWHRKRRAEDKLPTQETMSQLVNKVKGVK